MNEETFERLTIMGVNGIYGLAKVKQDEQEIESHHPDTLRAVCESWQRLAQYENTGLTPVAVARLMNETHGTTEMDLRSIQPGHMAVGFPDEEDGEENGIIIHEVSNFHTHGYGYPDADEDVKNRFVIRFSSAEQALTVMRQLVLLVAMMEENEHRCAKCAHEEGNANET